MKRIYLAGKVTGLPPEEVKKKFDLAASNIMHQNLGVEVFNPVSFVAVWHLGNKSWEAIMKACIIEMLQCHEVHLMPCWKDSAGAKLEYEIALRLKMKIVYL